MDHKTRFLEHLLSNLNAANSNNRSTTSTIQAHNPISKIQVNNANSAVPWPEAVQNIAQNHLDDLTTTQGHYFSSATKVEITQKAAAHFAKQIQTQSTPVFQGGQFLDADYQTWMNLWIPVVQDFHRNNYWNFATLEQPEEKVVARDENAVMARRFLFTAIMSLVVMKIVILYLGTNYSADPTPANRNKLIAAILFSLSSLGYFAIRNRKK